jgi:pimeloyl-ACP methyl ester carboxylesterase
MNTESAQEATLQLRDGRRLAYTEHGDLTGKPILFIHGNPGSRYVRHPDETVAQKLGVRIITPDRPGYGLSDFQPKRRLLDYPDDIIQLMDSLGINQFAVLGVSAGGPYAAACAYKLADRITRTAIVSSPAPFERENAYEDVHPSLRTAFQIVKNMPDWFSRFILWQQTQKQLRDPEKSLAERAAMLSTTDQNLLARPEIKAQVLGYRAEAVRQGVKGTLAEMQILVSPWGFRLEDIHGDIHIWHWESDLFVPIQMGHYLAQHIPNVHLHFLPDGGHYSIFECWREILESLIS